MQFKKIIYHLWIMRKIVANVHTMYAKGLFVILLEDYF